MARTRRQSKKSPESLEQEVPLHKQRRKRNKIQKKILQRKDLRSNILKKFEKSKGLDEIKEKNKDFCGLNIQKLSTVLNREKLCCPICLQIMILPVITTCGHAFCLPCITETFKHKKACSICREKLSFQSFNCSTMLKSLIDKFEVSKMSLEEIKNHKSRIETFKEKQIARIVNEDIQIGDLVDYYCQQQWIQGKIIEMNVEEQQLFLKIQPHNREGQVKQYNALSRFVSKHRYYTKESPFSRTMVPHLRIEIRDFSSLLMPDLWNLDLQDRANYQVNLEDDHSQFIRFTFNFRPNFL